MKALKVVRKAKERNIDLTTSMESLAIDKLRPRSRRRSHHEGTGWPKLALDALCNRMGGGHSVCDYAYEQK
ncbi:hypothetical protein KIN20_009561 [Parelaphostrongylus tenuis]|uniref:Uncharacterized protein n=1 Tax=Parelaphostrongylus tenuis TaxID=148309 RepID=A0AAD5QNF3_PARTN|nr:hypothetical protein KIN20_009561 [Parelaphostrongylus tenuis]